MEPLDLHPHVDGIRHTIRGLFRKKEDAIRKAESLARADLEVMLMDFVSPKTTQLFVVAAKHDIEPTRRTGIPRRHTTDWEATRMAVEAFRRTLGAASRSGDQGSMVQGTGYSSSPSLHYVVQLERNLSGRILGHPLLHNCHPPVSQCKPSDGHILDKAVSWKRDHRLAPF